MKNSWPKVDVSFSRSFEADHSLPWQKERHTHKYFIEAGYLKEVNPHLDGVTRVMRVSVSQVDDLIDKVKNKYLNEVLPCFPTLEMFACWFLANLPNYWDYVILKSYDGMTARIDRHYITNHWIDKLNARID